MASLDDSESTGPLGEAVEPLIAAEHRQSDEPTQTGDTLEFQRFINLPTELRDQIRREAVRQEWHDNQGWPKRHKKLFLWATISREWQDDVENTIFSTIRIDPARKRHASKFKEVFVQRRRRFLTCLQIIIDDRDTGPWHAIMGLSQISLVMEKVGHILQFISSWNLGLEKDGRQPPAMEICFVSLACNFRDYESVCFLEYAFKTTSLWTKGELDRRTNYGTLPVNMPMWVIKSEFPARLSNATSLTFPLDCVPLPAAMALLRTMPNLTSCSFELNFNDECPDGIEDLTDLVRHLPALAPALRELKIRNGHDGLLADFGTDRIRTLSTALRDYSQRLESLSLRNIHLKSNIFQPFVDEDGAGIAMSKWSWPKLKEVYLDFGNSSFYSSPGQVSETSLNVLMSAGRAAMNMPLLRRFDVFFSTHRDDVSGNGGYFRVDIKVSKIRRCRMILEGFEEDEEQSILAAWTPFMGAEARLVQQGLASNEPGNDDWDCKVPEYGGSGDAEPAVVELTYRAASKVFVTFPKSVA